VKIQDGGRVPRVTYSGLITTDDIRRKFSQEFEQWYRNKSGGKRIELLLFITPGKDNRWEYGPAKGYCDEKGIVSQCITTSNLMAKCTDRRFALNLLMKINAKLGGVTITLSSMPKGLEKGTVSSRCCSDLMIGVYGS